jgi:NADH-quinone oxidoreductase subunit L
MLVNRVGDVGLALGICVSFMTFKTVDYALTFALVPVVLNKSFVFFGFDLDVVTVISLLLF